jgi:hypothetical protein
VPLKWTRVFKVSRDISEDIEIFNLEIDDLNFKQEHDLQDLCQDSGWVPIFNPKDFEEEQKNFRCRDFKLDD